MNNTICYKASVILENDWIKKNSISHIFSNGRGEVRLDDCVKEIGDRAFVGSALYTIQIPESIVRIGDCAFEYCRGLSSIFIPDSVKEIGSSAFANCSALTTITIPNSIKEINSMCFYECIGLTTVVISESVTKVGYLAFFGCNNLKSIIIKGVDKDISEDAFCCCENLSKESIDSIFLCKLGFNTMSELNSNFIDKGDFIECRKPIKGIAMIQKGYSENLNWENVEKYAKSIRLGNFDDWLIPSIDELKMLYSIKDICGIKQQNDCFWSFSQKIRFEATEFQSYDYYDRLVLDFTNGKVKEMTCRIENSSFSDQMKTDEDDVCQDVGMWKVRCVRVTTEKKKNRGKEYF